MGNKKQSDIHIRCSEVQKKRIKNEADKLGLTISDYLLNSKNKTFIFRKDLIKLVEEVSYNDNKLDNNINQIAKNFNTNGFVVDDNVLKELLTVLYKVEQKRDNIITSLNKIIKVISE